MIELVSAAMSANADHGLSRDESAGTAIAPNPLILARHLSRRICAAVGRGIRVGASVLPAARELDQLADHDLRISASIDRTFLALPGTRRAVDRAEASHERAEHRDRAGTRARLPGLPPDRLRRGRGRAGRPRAIISITADPQRDGARPRCRGIDRRDLRDAGAFLGVGAGVVVRRLGVRRALVGAWRRSRSAT